jgi:hypothetical protein
MQEERDNLPGFVRRFYRGVVGDEIKIGLPHGTFVKEEERADIEKAIVWLREMGAEWKYGGLWVLKAGFITRKDC